MSDQRLYIRARPGEALIFINLIFRFQGDSPYLAHIRAITILIKSTFINRPRMH